MSRSFSIVETEAPLGRDSAARDGGSLQGAASEVLRLDYTVMNVCGARFARSLHLIIFNREEDEERRRADACYRSMADAISRRGVFVGRAPLDYHDLHMGQAMPSFLRACSSIKRALDPNSVIAPGKYGII